MKILLKPEEVSKKPKKTKVLEVLGLGVSQFLVFFETSSGFGKVFNENIAKPEEVSKKPKSRGENVAKT